MRELRRQVLVEYRQGLAYAYLFIPPRMADGYGVVHFVGGVR